MHANRIARVALLIGEPARATMMLALMDGMALTASELARSAGITRQTASSHLAQLVEAGLLRVEKQGRHRYHRIASPQVARLMENVMQLAGDNPPAPVRIATGPRDQAMRRARTCYDHFAGRLGVAIADRLVAMELIQFSEDSGAVTARGLEHFAGFGIKLEAGRPAGSSRPLCRPCLDWSERRHHVAGTLGAAICRHYLDNGLARQAGRSRVVELTPAGGRALFEMFGINRLD